MGTVHSTILLVTHVIKRMIFHLNPRLVFVSFNLITAGSFVFAIIIKWK